MRIIRNLKYFILLISITVIAACSYKSGNLKGEGSKNADYKDKGYDTTIKNSLDNYITNSNANFDTCIKYTKPFSKWDSHSLMFKDVWLMGEYRQSSIFPNYLFGGIGKRFNVSLEDLKQMPKTFLKNGVDNKAVYADQFLQNQIEYYDLLNLIIDSKSQIFLNQDNLLRVNNIYYENGKYWEYVIPGDSPFPMSDSITYDVNQKFTDEDFRILNKMKSLVIYAAYKDISATYLLIDGLLDNSLGYYIKNDVEYKPNHLFHFMFEEDILYGLNYYVVN